MEFDPTQPIWVQLVSEFARRIAVGAWQPGERLPGVRELASDLGVNPNTVQRSLAELERQDLCRSERTSGRFVTSDPARVQRLRQQMAEEVAGEFASRAKGYGLSLGLAIELITHAWETDDDAEH